MFAAAIPCLAQVAPATVSLSNGVQLSDLNQARRARRISNHPRRDGARVGQCFYRIFRDQNQLAVFGYELVVALSASGDSLAA